jgi:hypothetical protein
MRVVPLSELPRRVREIEHTWIPLPDGCRLAARIWLPEDAEADPVPAVLEYLPYRKNDGTAVRDAVRQPHLAGHGYAAVRVDMRGTGESDGIIENEYTAQEHADALAVIEWLAAQPWCTGSVGMTGISWGGFNSLQVAALRPPALKAIMTLCSTDDRYADDVHYRGGCVLASDMLHWASSMLTWNARPPDPRLRDDWRSVWLDRLERTPPFVEPWLTHQRRDSYWKHGSVCEDFGAISCAVYAVGGWADGYTNAVFRLLAGLSAPRKGLVGPWAHCFPDDASPGPSIGWLQECVRWWDHWLKGRDTGVMDGPMLRVWLQESVVPAPQYTVRAGRWVAEDSWPSARISVQRSSLSGPRVLGPVDTVGTEAGVWCASGQPGDLPGDQRADDAQSLVFDFDPLAEQVEILGFPEVSLSVEVDRPNALVCVRLCDVFPDGTSALVSRGLLNLTHREGHARPRPAEPGTPMDALVLLDAAAYSFPAGHRLRVAVSSSYWPWAWPSPESVTLTVLGGELALPVRPPRTEDEALPDFGEPEQAPPLEVEHVAAAPGGRSIRRDLATGLVEQTFDWDVGGTVRLVPIDLVSDDASHVVYSITEGDPLSASVRFRARTGMGRGEWSTRAEVTSTMTADAEAFNVTSALDAYEGATRVFARTWSWRFPRDHV